MKKISVIIIGAGMRGMGYARIAKNMPDNYEVVGVAEPVADRRNFIKDLFNLPDERCFNDWSEILALGKIADAAFICTMDRDHFAPTMKAIELGYDIMLEKPIAPTPEDCAKITKAANEKGVKVLICHVLRFTPFYGRLKQLILDGYVGEVQLIEQVEHVGLIHQSHSFVRGNWGNSQRSSTMLLQKSCHDIDILQWLMDKECTRVSSFGSTGYFNEKNAPEGAPERCHEGCPAADTCPFNSEKVYVKSKSDWFRCSVTKQLKSTDEQVAEAMRTTNYGRCVFRCDNDVVDHQVVNMEFEGGALVSFTMSAFNGWGGSRTIRIMGTKGMLVAKLGEETIHYDNAAEGTTETLPLVGSTGDNTLVGGHGGGDNGIMGTFSYLVTDEYDGINAATIETSCKNHMIVFAAEEAREKGTVVDVREYAGRYGM